MRKLTKRNCLNPVVASRILHRNDRSGRTWVVRIGKPFPHRKGDWACAFHISGIGMRGPKEVYGVDAFQALMLTLAAIHAKLNATGIAFQWQTEEPGDTGFARYLDSSFGLKLKRRLERMVEREIVRYSTALAHKIKRAKRKLRRTRR